MRVSFEIKGSKPEFSVNRLFYVFPRSLLIVSVMNFEKLGRFFPWFFPNRKCTSRNVEMNGNFFVRSIFVKLFKCFVLCFKVTLLCFIFVAILNPIRKRLSFRHQSSKQSKLKTMERLKNIRIRKFERDFCFSKILDSAHRDIIRNKKWKMNCLNQNLNYMRTNRPGDQIICSVQLIFWIMGVRITGAFFYMFTRKFWRDQKNSSI